MSASTDPAVASVGGDPAPGARSPRWASRSLRTRLVAGLLALLVVTFAVVGVSTTLALRGFLLDRLDAQLPAVAGPVARGLAQQVPDGPGGGGSPGGPDSPGSPGGTAGSGSASSAAGPTGGVVGGPDDGGGDRVPGGRDGPFDVRTVGGQPLGTLGVRLDGTRVDSATVVVATEGDGAPELVRADLPESAGAALVALPVGGRPVDLEVDGVGRFRAVALPAPGGTVVAALPTDQVDATTARLVAIELVAFASALALAGLAGALFVRSSLRPLRRVAAAATAVAATPMGSGAVTMPGGVADTDERTEVGQVGSAFNAMLGRVGASLAQRQATEDRLRRFVADASHELRTPLAAIRGHSELAGRQAASLPPDVAHALSRVGSESLRMGVLVDDLLLLARLDAGRPLAREEVDLTRLVLDVVSDAGAAERGRPGHRWRLDLPQEPVLVVGDGHRLHQVLANLLANARVHTPPGTEVTVRLTEAGPGRPAGPGRSPEPSGSAGPDRPGAPGRPADPARSAEPAPGTAPPCGEVELSVTDDGPGVPPEVADRVFERFVRADASRTRSDDPDGAAALTGSSGLGLAIVDAVVAAHGGTVDLDSVPGRTRFRVRLPHRPPAGILPGPPGPVDG